MISVVPQETSHKAKIASVAIDSPVPNLDRLFDYLIPEELEDSLVVGARVKVPFGRSKTLQDGFVIAIGESSAFSGKLAHLASMTSSVPVLPESSHSFLRSLAERQACTLGDLLKLAIPSRSVAIEKKFVAENSGYALEKKRTNSALTASLVEPRDNVWVERAITFAARQKSDGFSTIITVPDFRDLSLLKTSFDQAGIDYIDYTSDRKASARYLSFLACLTPGEHIVIGSRASMYAPLQNLGGIYLFDDGDDNLVEPTSPYVHTRDVALVRQSSSGCDLAIEAHYRSTEVQRLVDIGFFTDNTTLFSNPNVAVNDDNAKLPTMAWQLIRGTVLDEGKATLIQVIGKGVARSTYCFDCGERAKCSSCHGPIWIDASNTPKCRWCGLNNLNFKCQSCEGTRLRQGSGGASRTVTEIGKSFPGAQVIESTGDKPILEIKPGKRIVVATPGAEPKVAGGYGCVVILDANAALAKDSLRAQDIAIRNWVNAIALLSGTGTAVVSGLPQKLGQRIALWQLNDIAREELENRKELDFPPALRLASVQGEKAIVSAVISEIDHTKYQILGPISLKSDRTDVDQRFIIKYPYSQGLNLAAEIKSAISKQTAGQTRIGSNGRTSRAIKVRMDDPEVI